MKLLCEVTEEIDVLTEETEDGKKGYFIEGIFLQGNIKNRNGRVYPVEILDREVDKYTKNFIEKKRAYGELGHPNSPSINLDRVSHLITELRRDGDNFIGKAKIMETPNGKIVKALMDEGCRLGVSSRGLGSLKERNGSRVVSDDFFLSTAADIVADPSAPDCLPENIIEEVDWVLEGTEWKPRVVEKKKKTFKKKMDKIVRESKSREDREKEFFKLFEEFLNNLSLKN